MKIAFIGNNEPPDTLLELFKKMTPSKIGIWGQLEGVSTYEEADVFGVIDFLPSGLDIDESKCIFLGAHPPSMQAYKSMDNYRGIKSFDCKYTLGFLEWWLKYDYDYLTDLQPMEKEKDLCCIVSNADVQTYHKVRKRYLERFCNNNPGKLDIYGRIQPWGSLIPHYRGVCGNTDSRGRVNKIPNDHMSGKEDVYSQYRYAMEFDASANGGGYWSERIADCLLMWSSPIYWGCERLAEFLPPNCFSFLDINKSGEDVMSIMKGHLYKSKLPYIKEARDLILNKYQLWPRVHEAIFGVCR